MKTIGLLGGMSWESTALYYRLINEGVREKLGGIHSAQSLMYSVDFGEIEPEMETERWDLVLERLVAGSRAVERGGADFLVICTNTMHKLADQVADVGADAEVGQFSPIQGQTQCHAAIVASIY